jgi:multicomponent Na+:H+ antiporter subunit E
MNGIVAFGPNALVTLLPRAARLFGFWLVIAGIEPAEIIVGAIAAALAALASLRLSPPGEWRVSPLALLGFLARLLYRSVGAGIDVAWRALDPRLPLRPVFVVLCPTLKMGSRRDAFCTVTSLLPGTLPAGPNRDGDLLIHCLDAAQPVIEELTNEETRFARVFIGEQSHD